MRYLRPGIPTRIPVLDADTLGVSSYFDTGIILRLGGATNLLSHELGDSAGISSHSGTSSNLMHAEVLSSGQSPDSNWCDEVAGLKTAGVCFSR